MAVTITTSPAYPAAGQRVTLIGTADTGEDDATQWELTSTPRQSRLALGRVLERHPVVVRIVDVPLTYQAEDDARGLAATILRRGGSFIADGFIEGMLVDITGASTANNKRVTIERVEALRLTLSASDTLTTETATSTLTGAAFGQAGAAANALTFDAPGEYGITAYEVFYTSGAGGSYLGDPLSVEQRRIIARSTTTVHVGAHLDLPIEPVNGHGTTLRILVVDDGSGRGVVRGAELINPRTELARVAALDATVAAAVAALVGVLVNDIDTEFIADVNDICTKYSSHRILTVGSVHASADTTNALLAETANSVPAAIARLNDLAAKLAGHQRATSAGGTWHSTDDGKNTLQVAPVATTLAQAVVLRADLRERVYERHRVQIASPASHGAADNTNVIDPPLTLPAAIVAYLDFIANPAPSIIAGEAEGIGDAQASWGFRPAA